MLEPPFVHNGFLAEVKFVLVERKKLGRTSSFEDRFNTSKTGLSRNLINNGGDKRRTFVQDDEVPAVSPLEEQVTRPSFIRQSDKEDNFARTFMCRDEVTFPHRFGYVSSSFLHSNKGECSIVFRAEQRDVLLMKMTRLRLSGENCSSSLTFSTQDLNSRRGIVVTDKFCSPLEFQGNKSPIIVNSSLVFLDFVSNNSRDGFKGAFAFHNSECQHFEGCSEKSQSFRELPTVSCCSPRTEFRTKQSFKY